MSRRENQATRERLAEAANLARELSSLLAPFGLEAVMSGMPASADVLDLAECARHICGAVEKAFLKLHPQS